MGLNITGHKKNTHYADADLDDHCRNRLGSSIVRATIPFAAYSCIIISSQFFFHNYTAICMMFYLTILSCMNFDD